MIDWKVISGSKTIQADGWHFPSFEMQEYLLPIINPGFDYIDEYGKTTFTRDDCFRMKANIAFLRDSTRLPRKPHIRYDTFNKGVVVFEGSEIEACLTRLSDAIAQALTTGGSLEFYGD